MQFAWTGVILEKPMLEMACKIHSDKDGVRASHARVISLRSGAMIDSCFEAPGGLWHKTRRSSSRISGSFLALNAHKLLTNQNSATTRPCMRHP